MVVDYGMEPTAIARKQALAAVEGAVGALRECGRGEEADSLDYAHKWLRCNTTSYTGIAADTRRIREDFLSFIEQQVPTALYQLDVENRHMYLGTESAKQAYVYVFDKAMKRIEEDYADTCNMDRG